MCAILLQDEENCQEKMSLLRTVQNCGMMTVLSHVQATDGKINVISALVH
jgi:hypothetical protein